MAVTTDFPLCGCGGSKAYKLETALLALLPCSSAFSAFFAAKTDLP